MKFSVIIPVYNAAAYLRDCLESVVRPGVEVIAVDDGSTDESLSILNSFPAIKQSNNPNNQTIFRILRQPHAGVGAARNAGLTAAQGDWCLFVDADDVLADGWVDVLTEMIERHSSADMIGFGLTNEVTALTDGASGGVRTVREIDVGRVIPTDAFERLMPQFAYRRTLLSDVRFPVDLIRGEDKLFQGTALLRTNRVALTNQVLYGYRVRPGSAFHRPWNERTLTEELEWRTRWVRQCAASGKRMSPRLQRNVGLYLLEYFQPVLSSVADADVRVRVRALWRRVLKEVRALGFGWWQRQVMGLCARIPYETLVWLLCRLPYEIKRRTRGRR